MDEQRAVFDIAVMICSIDSDTDFQDATFLSTHLRAKWWNCPMLTH